MASGARMSAAAVFSLLTRAKTAADGGVVWTIVAIAPKYGGIATVAPGMLGSSCAAAGRRVTPRADQ